MKALLFGLVAVAAATLASCSGAGTHPSVGDPSPAGGTNTAMVGIAAGNLVSGRPITTASVKRAGTGLSIDLDGKHYDLPFQGSDASNTVNGKQYKVSAYYDDSHGAPAFGGNEVSLNYASLIVLGQVTAWNSTTKSGTIGRSEVIASGSLETPAGKLPAQIVQYDGQYALIVNPVIPQPAVIDHLTASGTFIAKADFGAGTVSFTMSTNGLVNLPSTVATIQGSHFSGNIAGQDLSGATAGKLSGAFYGPNAEEIAGVGSGTFESGQTPFSVGLIGGKTP